MKRCAFFSCCWLLMLGVGCAGAHGDVVYEEEVRFSSLEGTVTNRFILHVGAAGVRVDEAGPRTLIFAADARELHVLDRKTGAISDLASVAAEPRFVQLRESMERLAAVLRHLPEDKAAPLHAELIELRRGLRDLMRGVLPWSPSADNVPDLDQWVEQKDEVLRDGVACRRYVRPSGTGRRELLVVSWEALSLRPEALAPVDDMEAAWMEALAGKDESEPRHMADESERGFLLEERDLQGDRVLWEVVRSPPREVEAEANRYRLPGRPSGR